MPAVETSEEADIATIRWIYCLRTRPIAAILQQEKRLCGLIQ